MRRLLLLFLCAGASYASEEISVELPGGATMQMVWIEPGRFVMGSPASEPFRDGDEGPQHQVTISRGFYLGKYVITQAQWESVTETTPWSGQPLVQPNPDHPAVYISWNDVRSFIQQLNEKTGDEAYRLPTEAEWEYACRAGTVARWSCGDDPARLEAHAWYRKEDVSEGWLSHVGPEYAQPVGTKLPNPWGLHGMHGNVYEWCQDWYGPDYYRNSPNTDPQGPATGTTRVRRGGSFGADAWALRSANRLHEPPSTRGFSLGARLVRTK